MLVSYYVLCYHKLRIFFTKFFKRNGDLVEKYNTNLKTLLRQGITQPEFYGDVVYRLRKLTGSDNFSDRFTKCIRRFVRKGYDKHILYRTACVVVDPLTVNRFAFLFACAMTDPPNGTQ